MGIFDSITSLFEDSPAAPETQEPSQPLYSPGAMLSAHYSLGNLTATNQSLSQPNYPTSSAHMDNLTYTADMMERLEHEVGPFQLLSGYRTKELQLKLTEKGEPTSAVTSFHELGRAIDITPTTMGLTEYFGRLLANEELKKQFAEIAIKASQNAIHLSVNVPGDVRTTKVMGLNNEGVYARLGVDDITNYIAPFMESLDDAYDYAAAELVTYNRTPLIIGVVAAVGGVLYLLASGKRNRGSLRLNPRVTHRKTIRKDGSPKNLLTPLRREKIRKLYNQGFTLTEIANLFNYSGAGSVEKYVKDIARQSGSHPPISKHKLNKIRKLYKFGYSTHKIAKMFGYKSPGTIQPYIKDIARPMGSPPIDEHVLKKIRELYKKGYSLTSIAKMFGYANSSGLHRYVKDLK